MGADRRVLCLALCALQLVSQLAHGARPAVSYTDGVGPRRQPGLEGRGFRRT